MDRVRARAASIPGLEVRRLPRKWERIGDVLLLRIPPDLAPWREAIASIYRQALGATTVLEDAGHIHGPWRVPRVRWLLGDGTETVHVEGGIRFKLDVAKLMFSSGNLEERLRIAESVQPGETVVDLFAGIGYFSIPIAVRGNARRVAACEVNPTAFHYLVENVRLNRAGTVDARLGDCRETAPKGIADRVILGHFDAARYLDTAFRAAKDEAKIHVHGLERHLGPKTRPPDPPSLAALHETAARHGYRVTKVVPRFVKWYASHRAHFVLDADVAREQARKVI